MEPAEKKYSWRKNNLGIWKINRKYRKNCPKNTKKWILSNQYLQDALAMIECIKYHLSFVKQFWIYLITLWMAGHPFVSYFLSTLSSWKVARNGTNCKPYFHILQKNFSSIWWKLIQITYCYNAKSYKDTCLMLTIFLLVVDGCAVAKYLSYHRDFINYYQF